MKPRPLDRAALRHHPLPPVADGDKESKGRLLVVAGSRTIPGAAILTATAAMRAGAGKLTIATGASVATAIGVAIPEAMVIGLAERADGALAASAADRLGKEVGEADAVVAGPGMAPGGSCGKIAAALFASHAGLALDAALLHALKPPKQDRHTQCILLPHAGELAALLDNEKEEIETNPIGCGLRAAERYRSIVLVKGIVSHVVTPDGEAWTYEGGAPGLGVSGSGDVLAGIVAGLLARGAEPLNALLWAVWLHGQAGAALAKKIGPIGFLARQIADEVPALLPR